MLFTDAKGAGDMDGIITKDRLLFFKSSVDEYSWLTKSKRELCRQVKLKGQILEEQNYFKSQIRKLKKQNYQRILMMRYLYHFSWSRIIEVLFFQELDYMEQKDAKYRDTVMYWHRQALKELEKVSSTPEEVSALKRIQKIKNFCKKELNQNLTPNKDEFIKKLLSKLK